MLRGRAGIERNAAQWYGGWMVARTKAIAKEPGAFVAAAKSKEKGTVAKPAKAPAAKPAKPKKKRLDNTEYVDYLWDESPTPTYATIAMLADFGDIFSFAFAEVRPEAAAVRDRSDKKLWVPGHVVASIRVPPSSMPYIMAEFVRAWNKYVEREFDGGHGEHRKYEKISVVRTRK